MKPLGRVWRKFLKRHAEAIFIIAFILADCFLSGWALTLGTVVAILYVFMPAIRCLLTLTPLERITFIKAFVKTAKVHRLALLLFWIYSIRILLFAATSTRLLTLFESGGTLPSLSSALIVGAQELAPLAFLASPIVIYFAACLIAIISRSRLKATKQDPDLIKQRQRWAGASHFIFLAAFIASILSITLNTHGPAYMLSNWMLASARDANLFCGGEQPPDPAFDSPENQNLSSAAIKNGADGSSAPQIETQNTVPGSTAGQDTVPDSTADQDTVPGSTAPQEPDSSSVPQTPAPFMPSPMLAGSASAPMLQGVYPSCDDLVFADYFDTFILSSTSAALFIFFLEIALKLNAFLSSFCWRVVSFRSLQNVIEGFLEALRLPARTLNFREANPFWSNAARTLAWLLTCYAALFWLFGFCSGPLGYAIQNWMMASVVDAGFAPADQAPAWLFEPRIRIFLGAIVALYGTAPIAVSAAVVLPYAKPRKIILNGDGLSFAQGPFLPLWGRQFRLWSDLKSMTVKVGKSPNSQCVQPDTHARQQSKAKFTLRFRSGGQISFDNSQLSAQDLRVLLDCIDQHASACAVDPEVFSVCRTLEDADRDKAASDGMTETSIASIPAQEFKSTIFIPFSAGEFLPGTKTRIIKQLSSKPLCAVYLGRNEDGRMVTVKQFYLPEDNDETRALSKILRREYELLTRLDHPGIAKVLDSFTVEKSTYLVIEHRLGIDLRATVQEHGARSEGLTIAWARQLCEIMIHLHACEPAILHRDLTPDNVIAGEDGQLRLIDFGAAREFLDGITGTMIGKHCYVAPEQLRGEANQRSDIYSFGCSLHFLLSGRDPIALSQSSPAKNIDCSDELNKLVEDCTEFDEQKRPQSFREVLDRLNDLDKGIRLKLPASKQEAFA